jgi:hypothetical protein
VADLLLAFDARLDRPISMPADGPDAIDRIVSDAAFDALDAAAGVARQERAAALVLFGETLDPKRASPAQAARLRRLITSLASEGCRTVWVTVEEAAATEVSRALGAPAGLIFACPSGPARLSVRGRGVDVVADGPNGLAVLAEDPGTGTHPLRWHAHGITGDGRLRGSGQPLESLQPRSAHEPHPGQCGAITLFDRIEGGGIVESFRTFPTQQVAWRTVRVAGGGLTGEEDLATDIWKAIEDATAGGRAAVEFVRIVVDCGGNVAKRLFVSQIAAGTLARVQSLFDPRSFRVWCQSIEADRREPLERIERGAAAGAVPGVATFAASLAGLARSIEEPADIRESAWLALELLEVA